MRSYKLHWTKYFESPPPPHKKKKIIIITNKNKIKHTKNVSLESLPELYPNFARSRIRPQILPEYCQFSSLLPSKFATDINSIQLKTFFIDKLGFFLNPILYQNA